MKKGQKSQTRGRNCALVMACALCATMMGMMWSGVAAAQGVSAVSGGTPPAANLPKWPKKDSGKLTLSAQALEKPDLQFTLLPRAWETDPGNAAVKYMAATGQLPRLTEEEVQLRDLARDARLDAVDDQDSRLKDLLEKYRMALRLQRDAARMESVEWEVSIRKDGIAALLPWLTQQRELANALCIAIRLDIKRHDWAAAQDKLQTGFMQARHLGQGHTLIEALVGDAVAGLMLRCVEDWISEPGAPNLYWPLSNLPSPFTDLRGPMSYEQSFAYFSMPELREMHNGHFSPDLWTGLVNRFSEVSSATGGGMPVPGAGIQTGERQAAATAMGMAMYPQAKAFLIERGIPRDQVERMPVPEVLGRYFVRSFEEAGDDVFKWIGLPPAQSLAGLKQWQQEFEQKRQANQVNIMAALLLPSLGRAVQTNARLDRQIAALRIVEALRAYAAERGQLPDNLEALTLPLPADPASGAFQYRRQGDMATISSPDQENARDAVHYELTLRK